MMKLSFVIVALFVVLSPSFVSAETMEGYTCFREHLDNVVLKNAVAINCTITNSDIISTSVADSIIETSTIDSSSITHSEVHSSTIIASSVTQSHIEKSSIQGGSALFFSHLYDTTVNGGIIRDTYGERMELHAIDVQRSEFRQSKIFNAYLKDTTIGEAYLESFTAEDATLKGVVLQKATLIETFIENGWLDLFKAEHSTFMNANIGNAEIHHVTLCKTWNRDNFRYYGDCQVVNGEATDGDTTIPFIRMYLIYTQADHEVIRHNFNYMVDKNTIAVATGRPIVENNVIVAYDTYMQEININNRLVEAVSQNVGAGAPGQVPAGQYTDLWIPKTTKVGDYVNIRDTTMLVGAERDNVWYVGNYTNSTTFGALVYDKETGIFLGYNTPTPAARLNETNAPVTSESW